MNVGILSWYDEEKNPLDFNFLEESCSHWFCFGRGSPLV